MGPILGFFSKLLGGSTTNNSQSQNVVVNVGTGATDPRPQTKQGSDFDKSRLVRVLFIDNDTRFKIIKILRKYDWIKCDILGDLVEYDLPLLKEADIVFIDIEGVGKKLRPKEQGLGIVVDIHTRYPDKHIVIYSSSTKRDMTHQAFSIATGTLYKESEPSQFLRYIEDVRTL